MPGFVKLSFVGHLAGFKLWFELVHDGNTSRPPMLSTPLTLGSSMGRYPDGGDGREMGAKRQRLLDQGPSFYELPLVQVLCTIHHLWICCPASTFPCCPTPWTPLDCTETDVAEFFHGLDIVDVLFVHRGGKFTGEAFCVLGYPLQVDFALQKNRQNMGRRYVEVFRSKRQDYYKAIANEVSDARGGSPRQNAPRAKSYDEGKDSAEHTGVLRLRGAIFCWQG
ncbi:hypothetical protein GH714_039789 [Hevea brasiliensis]|uniref:RRM domain-containing protein n=1 Tax=Hevea brasiliensis TaxID=3981 RepID=A0A6A6KEU2_HEVBR|nr:hypothetical protein GH714_039789 [Hevea brasiliensis]